VQWTTEDVEKADLFYKTHNAGFQQYPFPKALFMKFVKENNGYFPVRIEALPEGTCANIHVPVYQITAEGEYSRLITFLETLLTQVWYPSTVATLSRRTRDIIAESFDKSVDKELHFLLESRLHDFGFRGCTCVEQSILGGTAHLLNFTGSDTMSACYYAQFYLNNGNPVATSIPATEHSVMTSWPNERLAISNMIQKFGGEGKLFACVMDSYDYGTALDKVLPSLANDHKKQGGLMILRPDSGDPVECIVQALKSGEKTFGASANALGYKMVNNVATIQGDGINDKTVRKILEATLAAGYSAANVAFGMGSGLLQKVNRDTMSFATKLNYIQDANGNVREVMKKPKTDGGKCSFPGMLKVLRVNGQLTVFPRTVDEKVNPKDNELKVVYDHGPIDDVWDDFDTVRQRVAKQWPACAKTYNPISQQLADKIKTWISDHNVAYEAMLKGMQKEIDEAI
jgi:nicotinamide phosphoribosyltransferase